MSGFSGEVEGDFLLWRRSGNVYKFVYSNFYDFDYIFNVDLKVPCLMKCKFFVDRHKPRFELLSYDIEGVRFDLEKLWRDLPSAFRFCLHFDNAKKYHVDIDGGGRKLEGDL
jgi:hypothetical protein